jgi:hypothetical protein
MSIALTMTSCSQYHNLTTINVVSLYQQQRDIQVLARKARNRLISSPQIGSSYVAVLYFANPLNVFTHLL